MSTDAPPRADNVIAALANVMRDLPSIGRDHTSPQGYQYRGIEDITRAAQPLLAREGVVMAPHRVVWDETYRFTINNRPWSDERLTVTYRVYGPGGPADFIEVEAPGIGRDNADKGANKAMTQAFKYALIQALCIADARDDADAQPAHQGDAAHQPASQDAIEKLRLEVEAAPAPVREQFTAWKNDQGFPWPWPDEAVDAMRARLDGLLGEHAHDQAAGGPGQPVGDLPAAAPLEEPASPAEPEPGPSEPPSPVPDTGETGDGHTEAETPDPLRAEIEAKVEAMTHAEVAEALTERERSPNGSDKVVRARLVEVLVTAERNRLP